MRLLTYSICVLAGLAVAVVVVAVIGAGSTPAPLTQPPPVAANAAASATPSIVHRRLKPHPWEVPPEPPPPLKYKELDATGLAKLLGGPDVIAVLDGADRVTSVLLKLPQNQLVAPSKIRATTDEVAVDTSVGARIRAALFDPTRNRQIDGGTGCAPQYGWRVSFIGNERRVDFYFCFGCGHLAVDLDGKTVGHAQFQHVADELKEVMNSISHGDSVLPPPEEAGAPTIPLPPAPGALR